MADELERFEAMLGAFAKVTAGEVEGEELVGARCPKCEAASFIKVSSLYDEARRRLEEEPAAADVARDGGVTDRQVAARFAPPERRSAVPRLLLVAVPLAVAAFFLYRRFGRIAGQVAGMALVVISVIVFLTTTRRLSDAYYDGRQRWRKLFMCRRCGQLVAS